MFFGTISVILSLTVYIIIYFKEIQKDHKQRYVIYILVLISVVLAMTLPRMSFNLGSDN